MEQKTRSAQTRQRILDAAMAEFSSKGYEGASLNAACAENGFSKGVVYHHFKDKNELYLLCVQRCFNAVTERLKEAAACLSGTAEERLRSYFDARLRFFTQNPLYLGVFAGAAFRPPAELAAEVEARRKEFDRLNLSVLTSLLEGKKLRIGLSPSIIAEDLKMYMDYLDMRLCGALHQGASTEQVMLDYEERYHRQIGILLHGVFGE